MPGLQVLVPVVVKVAVLEFAHHGSRLCDRGVVAILQTVLSSNCHGGGAHIGDAGGCGG